MKELSLYHHAIINDIDYVKSSMGQVFSLIELISDNDPFLNCQCTFDGQVFRCGSVTIAKACDESGVMIKPLDN